LRYRILSVSTPTAPVIDQLRIDQGSQYVKTEVVQGQTQNDPNLGTADGVTPDQEFESTRDGFIDESEVLTVAAVAWVRVENFLQSRATDRHYVVELGENDRAKFKFGDGTKGAIPSGQVGAVYRYGVQQNGNVGAGTIVVDKSGLAFISDIWNPRAASGWQEAESASEDSLELSKILGPASLRIVNVALGPDDVVTLALRYTDPDTGVKPVVRAKVIEGAFGPKTMELVIVVAGGGAASATLLQDLDTYFNGDQYATPPVSKKVIANQEVTSTNYSQKVINVSATVYGAASVEAIEDSLTALLQPEARREDGVTFEWEFGGDVFLSRITHEIHAADEDVTRIENLLLNGSAANVALGDRELPVAGTITITEG
jgi:hypothetical protein